jgi:hypothetical protein
MQSLPPDFSWLKELALPVFFTLFGAAIGFALSQVQDSVKARKAKQAFMRAISVELDVIEKQLGVLLKDVNLGGTTVGGRGRAPRFDARLRTAVYAIQVAKLRDVDDALTIDVIHFYSDLSALEPLFDAANNAGDTYNRADSFSGAKDAALPHARVAIVELGVQIQRLKGELKKLRPRLPLAGSLPTP